MEVYKAFPSAVQVGREFHYMYFQDNNPVSVGHYSNLDSIHIPSSSGISSSFHPLSFSPFSCLFPFSVIRVDVMLGLVPARAVVLPVPALQHVLGIAKWMNLQKLTAEAARNQAVLVFRAASLNARRHIRDP